MRLSRLAPLAPLALFTTAVACGSVPDDPGARLFPPGGIIRGTVLYQGPRPCSSNGHIVGNAILLVFDRRNPPPPTGLANTAVNFADVTGDRLFANEPRYTGSDTYCPADHGFTETITVSAPFEIGSVTAGSYMLESFFDYTGNFLPTFKFRNLPEKGDVAGGYLDTADALKPNNAGNPNYSPKFLPIDIGTPQPLPSFDPSVPPPPDPIPNYTMPSSGFVADNITVSIGQVLPIARPYFYPQGATASVDSNDNLTVTPGASSDGPATKPVAGALEDPNDPDAANYEPILTIPQDIQVLAGPKPTMDPTLAPKEANLFESSLPHLKLVGGLPKADATALKMNEQAAAIDPLGPFHFQLPPAGGTFFVWQDAVFNPNADPKTYPTGYVPQYIPEGQVPYLWPLVVLNKLQDDPKVCDASGNCQYHPQDPASLTAQGDANHPVIILQGITLLGTQTDKNGQQQPESVFWSGADASSLGVSLLGATPLFDSSGQPVKFAQDHVTALLRPSVICFDSLFDATNPDKRGTLVTPYKTGPSADIPADPNGNIVPPDLLTTTDMTLSSVKGMVKQVKTGCLPMGRYAINLVYPDGQAWTVPNEAGACSGSEGATDYQTLTCSIKGRPVLYSQGTRAVVEITAAKDPSNCSMAAGKVPPVPSECVSVGQ